ncbi:MAG TPA: chalcone isomerase family protein, partial [Oceanipulchritudo sp.]|nr:chalcone isomerase family protein [Oceanipulchritudo sp.]
MKSPRVFSFLALAILGALPHSIPAQAGDFTFPATIQAGPTELIKVGEGTFRWMMIRVYSGSFYMDAVQPDADPLSDVAKRLELSYRIGFSAEDFRKSGNEILARNCHPEELASLEERLERLNAAYQPVEAGDRYSLTYV